ncbi:hypothetical protein [Ktedonobacter robiniae]|uniref:Cytochrome c domain-containing protein n=1 Tax=Ktedonobacter robiniae TaxID=2778365 RepID=A0ABQ3UXK1_9CHLR|nr:hypothetical protein [Ktedonobacter robiniae]GHO57421.1 hypothetical protein KSB_58960 [Ktedonobacter robiniae]
MSMRRMAFGAQGGYSLARLLMLFINTYSGRIIGSSLVLIAGIIYGLQSHAVSYDHAPAGTYHIVLDAEEGRYYLHCEDCHNTIYYIAQTGDFKQFVQFDSSAHLEDMIYRSDALENVNVDGQTGKGYELTYIAQVNASGQKTVYETQEHQGHPDDYFDNRWTLGLPIMALGGALLVFSVWILISDKRKFTVKQAARPVKRVPDLTPTPLVTMSSAPHAYGNSYQEFSASTDMRPYQGPRNLPEQ